MFLKWNKRNKFLKDYIGRINIALKIHENIIMPTQNFIKKMLFLPIYNKISRKLNYLYQNGQLIYLIIS